MVNPRGKWSGVGGWEVERVQMPVQLPTQVAEHDEHEVESDEGQEDKEKNEL